MNRYMEDRNEKGFTLIELLIAIVVVGILTAVAIVGIAGLTDKGAKSACQVTKDAVKTAQAVHFSNSDTYPAKFTDMTGTPKELDDESVTVTDVKITGKGGWSLDRTAAGTATTPLQFTSTGC